MMMKMTCPILLLGACVCQPCAEGGSCIIMSVAVLLNVDFSAVRSAQPAASKLRSIMAPARLVSWLP